MVEKLKWTLVGLPLLLGGCFVPLPITIASLTLSGAAYLDTGKTMPEHALSAATAQDCSFFRLFDQAREVCEDEAAGDIMLAGGPAPAPTVAAGNYPGCRGVPALDEGRPEWSQCGGLLAQ